MIRAVESASALEGFCGNAFACRVRATANAYGFSQPFARFWTQEDKAALCALDDTAILDARPGADFGELAAFLSAAGARTLLCSAEAALALPFPAVSGEVMTLTAPVPPMETGVEWNPSPRELHPLLCACETPYFTPPPFEPFYLDVSHRTRHGAAVSVAIRAGDTLAGCAVCCAKTDDAAVLSAVAVRPQYRRQGLGARVVRALASALPRRTLYLFRAAGENEAFYRSLGFVRSGGFSELDCRKD